MNKIPRERPRGRALRADAAHVAAGPAPVPAPSRSCGVLQRSREPSRLPRLPRSKGPGQAGKQKPFRAHRRLRGATTAQSLRGAENRGRVLPLTEALVIGPGPRHSALRGRGGGGAGAGLGREGAWTRGPAGRALSPPTGVAGSALARTGRAQPARGRKSSEARREVRGTGAAVGVAASTPAAAPAAASDPQRSPRPPRLPRSEGVRHPPPAPAVRAMAPRKNAKGGGGGNSSSSSGSGSSSGGSSSPGARRGQRRSGRGSGAVSRGSGAGGRDPTRGWGPGGARCAPISPGPAVRLLHPPRRSSSWRGRRLRLVGRVNRPQGPRRAGFAASGWSRRRTPSRLIPHLQGAAEVEVIAGHLPGFPWGGRGKRNNLPLRRVFGGLWK